MPDLPTESELAELAIAVYIEELATDRRVLYLGDSNSRGAERLAKVARSVDLVSPRSRVRGTKRGGRVQPRRWPSADDRGRWDVVVVPDVMIAGLADDPRFEEIGDWIAEGGVLVAGTRDRTDDGGLEYGAFYDLLQASFESVRMVGQAPFRGFALVDFAPPGELEVTFDGSLLEGTGERARRYLALCADEDVVLDAYAVVQIPSSVQEVVSTPVAAPSSAGLEERLREQQEALDRANVHAEELEHELEASRASLTATASNGAEARIEAARAAWAASAAADADARVEAASASLQLRIRELEKRLVQKRAPAEASSASEPSFEAEYVRIETALAERGRELTAVRCELDRRALLVRDLVEELVETGRAPGGPARGVAPTPLETLEWAPGDLQRALQQQIVDAVERAVVAEAERAELSFQLDEARGSLAVAGETPGSDLEEMRRMEAALRGTVRGLNARLADVIELYQLTQARLTLVEDDANTTRARCHELEREVVEARERAELEIARVRTKNQVLALAQTVPPAGGAYEATLAAREGQLMGALMRCQEEATNIALERRRAQMEAQLAREALVEHEERLDGQRIGYETRIAELVSELERTAGEADRALVEAGQLRSELDDLVKRESALHGELTGQTLRLADREAAVRELVESSSGAPPSAAASRRELAPELARVRAEAEGLRAELEAMAGAHADDDELPLRVLLGARDAMISRLQTELTHASERNRQLQHELERKLAALVGQRDEVDAVRAVAGVEVEEGVRELEELTDRLEQSEVDRKRALESLGGAREILELLLAELPEHGSDVDLGAGDVKNLRDRLSKLDAEAADREVLLRSMTAQLQERDDRIRALERFDPSDAVDPVSLQASLLEMEERVARLRDELDNERRARRHLEED